MEISTLSQRTTMRAAGSEAYRCFPCLQRHHCALDGAAVVTFVHGQKDRTRAGIAKRRAGKKRHSSVDGCRAACLVMAEVTRTWRTCAGSRVLVAVPSERERKRASRSYDARLEILHEMRYDD